DDSIHTGAEIFLDRTAFKPGDKVLYKCLLYYERPEYHVCEKGKKLTAVLLNASNEELDSNELYLNEFGSASGEFALNGDIGRGGRFSIRLLVDGKIVNQAYFVVDDFVLPDFVIDFKPVQRYFYGDTVNVSGKLSSFSGHGLSGASVIYSVIAGNDFLSSGSLVPDESGEFNIGFVASAPDEYWYRVTVKVTDVTGETYEKSVQVYVADEMDLYAEIGNGAESDVSVTGLSFEDVSVVTDETVEVKFNVSG
ncbi:protein containing Alpha-2-macroglobulin, partial [gut metagenome]